MTQEIVLTDYEVMFTIHTGITVLIPKQEILNASNSDNLHFLIEDKSNITIISSNNKLIIKDFKKDYLEEAKERNFIMLYELEDDEVVRCTACHSSES